MNTTLSKDKSLMDSIYKREILAGLLGGIFVFVIVVVFYLYNGLIYKKNKIIKN
jgi:hypothetical protein